MKALKVRLSQKDFLYNKALISDVTRPFLSSEHWIISKVLCSWWFPVVSGAAGEETPDAGPDESWTGGPGDAVSLWPAGPPHQGSDAAGEGDLAKHLLLLWPDRKQNWTRPGTKWLPHCCRGPEWIRSQGKQTKTSIFLYLQMLDWK